MTLGSRQIAMVLYPGVTALDVIGPHEVLRAIPGAEVRFVAREAGPVVTDGGVLVLGATHGFEETPRPWMVLVPSSTAHTPTAMADRRLIAWLRAVHPTTEWTTSVCSGALVLAAAGLLEGLEATTHWAGMDTLARFGAIPRPDARVVRSGRVWTAAGVSAGIDLGLALLAETAGRRAAEVEQLIVEYDPRSPFACGHMDKAPTAVATQARAELARRARNPRNAISIPTILWNRYVRRIRRRASAHG
jgi:transcriptional regulator GlxA family with amidase domain